MKILKLRFSKKLLSFHHSEYERLCLRCVSSLTTVNDVTRQVRSTQFPGSLLLPSPEPPHSPTRTVKRASMCHLFLLRSAYECELGSISRHPVYLSTLLGHHSAEAAHVTCGHQPHMSWWVPEGDEGREYMVEILAWKAGSPHSRTFPWGKADLDGEAQARWGKEW